MTDEQVRKIIQDELKNILKIDRYMFDKAIQILDGRNIQTGITNGTIIHAKPTQKLGFYGTPGVVQQTAVSNPSGGATQDTEARNAIISILTRLRNLGLIDT